MVGKNNILLVEQKRSDKHCRYGIRKLSVGVASVLLGVGFFAGNSVAHADTTGVSNGNQGIDTENSNKTDTSRDVYGTQQVNADQTVNAQAENKALSQVTSGVPASQNSVNSSKKEDNLEVSSAAPAGLQGLPESRVVEKNDVTHGEQNKVSVNKSVTGQNQSLPVSGNLTGSTFALLASKVVQNDTQNDVNGGFDSNTWGTLDVSKWTGQENNGVYELTGYTGDLEHIIVPNSADFAKAGQNVGQVGISADTTHSWFEKGSPKSIAFSKTDDQMIKAVGSNWTSAFTGSHDRFGYNVSKSHDLINFDGSTLNINDITNMSNMFSGNRISDLTSLANWKTDKVTDMNYMFSSNQVSNLMPLANWKTDKVTDMNRMFSSNRISDLTPLANWKTDKVTDMSSMFYSNRISDLTPLANWKTDKVTSMSYMFSSNQVHNLTPLANWEVDNVTNMRSMFFSNQISNLTPLANWKTDNVTDMSYIFCSNQISDLTPLANWKVDNVTDMSYMFRDNKLSYADLTKWTFNKTGRLDQFINQPVPSVVIVKAADQVLLSGTSQGSSYSTTQYPVITTKQNQLHFGSDTVDMPTVYVATDKDDARQKILADINTKLADYQKTHLNYDIKPVEPLDQLTELTDLVNAKFTAVKRTLPELDTNDAFSLDPTNGLHEHKNVNDNGGYDKDFWGTLDVSKFTTVKNGDNLEITGYTGDTSNVIVPNIADFWVNGLDQGAKQVTISSSVMRDLAKNATQIGLSKTNNQKVVASDSIWQNAFSGLTANPQTGDNATGGIIIANPKLRIMDLHNLDTSNVTDMNAMFNGGSNLITVGDLSNWNTSNVTNMRGMFQRASSLTDIGDLDKWDTSNVTDMSYMFNVASKLQNLGNLDNWNTSKVTNMSAMFNVGSNLITVGDLSNWDTSNVTDMKAMFQGDSSLTNIGNLSKWNTSNVTNMSYMFSFASKLQNLGSLDDWNTSKVTDMNTMFNGDSNLITVGDLSNWDTSNVTNMAFMFANDTSLTNIGDLSKWNTSKVTNMSTMFQNDPSLTNIGDLSNWDTSNVTDMAFMFANDSSLTNIGDLSKWDTSKVTNMSTMFQSASSLTSIGNLDKWDTSNVTNMGYMFNGASKLQSLGNLNNWNTSNVTNMKAMFQNDSSLTNIGDLSKWDTSKVTDMSYMFVNDPSLTNIGDLSKWDTSKVTNMSYMFTNDSSLTNIGDLSKWDTSQVTDMSYMFGAATALTNLNISNWDLQQLSNQNCLDYFVAADPNLTIIANNVKLPTWYDKINGANIFTNGQAVITNNQDLLDTTGVSDTFAVDDSKATRSIFYNSNGSNDGIDVLTKANQDYMNRYAKDHPGYTLNLSNSIDKTNPIALANAKFVTVDSPSVITFTDTTDTDKAVPDKMTVSGKGQIDFKVPDGYEVNGDLPDMYYGTNYTIDLKRKTQDVLINYTDENGKVIKTDKVAGKIGDPIKIDIPGGYHFVDGKVPTVVITENPEQTMKIVKDQHETGDPTTGDKDVLNLINYTDENGKVIKADKVTGKVGDTVKVDVPDGYHFVDGEVPTVVITNNPAQTVKIVKDQHETGEPTTSSKDTLNLINYTDESGKVIKTDKVTGKIGDKVNVTVPDGYHFVDGKVPTVVVTNDPEQAVKIVKDQHETGEPATSDKDALNLINYTDENGKVIKTDKVTGMVGDKVTVTVPDGYHFVDGKVPTVVITNDPEQAVKIVKDQHETGDETSYDLPKLNYGKPGDETSYDLPKLSYGKSGDETSYDLPKLNYGKSGDETSYDLPKLNYGKSGDETSYDLPKLNYGKSGDETSYDLPKLNYGKSGDETSYDLPKLNYGKPGDETSYDLPKLNYGKSGDETSYDLPKLNYGKPGDETSYDLPKLNYGKPGDETSYDLPKLNYGKPGDETSYDLPKLNYGKSGDETSYDLPKLNYGKPGDETSYDLPKLNYGKPGDETSYDLPKLNYGKPGDETSYDLPKLNYGKPGDETSYDLPKLNYGKPGDETSYDLPKLNYGKPGDETSYDLPKLNYGKPGDETSYDLPKLNYGKPGDETSYDLPKLNYGKPGDEANYDLPTFDLAKLDHNEGGSSDSHDDSAVKLISLNDDKKSEVKPVIANTVSDKEANSTGIVIPQRNANQLPNTLPQTGNKSGWQLALTGVISLLGALGLARKKKRN